MCFNIGIVTCGPNEALIISGLFQGAEGTLVVGGRAIVLPGIDTDSLLLGSGLVNKHFIQAFRRSRGSI